MIAVVSHCIYFSSGWLPKPVSCCKKTTETRDSNSKDEVEMNVLEEELIDSNGGDQSFKEARKNLISILRKSRNNEDLILGEDHVKILRLAYTQYCRYPKKIQEFFELVIDFADDKTMELVMDHSWQFQRNAVRF